jgi:hypothetical protein
MKYKFISKTTKEIFTICSNNLKTALNKLIDKLDDKESNLVCDYYQLHDELKEPVKLFYGGKNGMYIDLNDWKIIRKEKKSC